MNRGEDGPPVDLRYLRKGFSKQRTSSASVASFLEGIYQSVAETLPELAQQDVESTLAETAEEDRVLSGSAFQARLDNASSPRLKKGWGHKRAMKIQRKDLPVRHLPPGTMKEYWEQYRSIHGPDSSSFPTFWRVWLSEFHHLRFRTLRQHAQCSICLRYKLLIRRLGRHVAARQLQIEKYHLHLRNQYADRLSFWERKGRFEIRSPYLCAITDGMDQAKFAYPRAPCFIGKDFASWSRPRAHISATLVHGHCLIFYVSNFDMAKDSNASMEGVAHALTVVSKEGYGLHGAHFHLQADNCVREVKNNTCVRMLSGLVSNRLSVDQHFFSSRGVLHACACASLGDI